ncbi:hypothetical protein BLNAU_17645 [Blattamonas nauphoetae]|uniref:Uncharacterized protein n=1 Tax=Blattamonas nauphoetae TaxID=2049346 RepID=A0ABQ9X6J9_9EUKA|nr:hypothetical protein BLNAU_17645 [Blattamonas nauphoetae]
MMSWKSSFFSSLSENSESVQRIDEQELDRLGGWRRAVLLIDEICIMCRGQEDNLIQSVVTELVDNGVISKLTRVLTKIIVIPDANANTRHHHTRPPDTQFNVAFPCPKPNLSDNHALQEVLTLSLAGIPSSSDEISSRDLVSLHPCTDCSYCLNAWKHRTGVADLEDESIPTFPLSSVPLQQLCELACHLVSTSHPQILSFFSNSVFTQHILILFGQIPISSSFSLPSVSGPSRWRGWKNGDWRNRAFGKRWHESNRTGWVT